MLLINIIISEQCLHGSNILQNSNWADLTGEGFVGSDGAPFESRELAISVKVDDISESILRNK